MTVSKNFGLAVKGLTEDVIDLGVTTKRKGKGDDIGISNTDDWVGRDPKTEYHYILIKNIRRQLFKNNLHKCQKFLCRNCFRLCSSSDFYNIHLKHCLDVNDGQKTIFPIRGKNDSIQFNKFEAKLAYPFVITFDLESILTLWTPGDGLPTLRKLPYAARSLLTDGTVYERSGW